MSIDTSEFMEYFLDFSVVVTGFSRFDLQGTGQAPLYFETVQNMIGDEIFKQLLETFHDLDLKAKKESKPHIVNKGLDSDILASGKLGPVARNIVKLWYMATWEQLPDLWYQWYGICQDDEACKKEKYKTFIVSPQAYPEGLLWRSIGVNPPAAKAPGYGTWSEPPSVSLS